MACDSCAVSLSGSKVPLEEPRIDETKLKGDVAFFTMILLPALILGSLVSAQECLGKKQFIKPATAGKRYLAIEVLDDDLVHFEASELRKPPAGDIYRTQMIDNDNYATNYCGPTVFQADAQFNSFSTNALIVNVNPDTLAVSVFDKLLNTTLTTFTFADMAATLNKLQWTKEKTTSVYGIAAAFAQDSAFGSADGNWVGKKYSPSRPAKGGNSIAFGNNMESFDKGAASNTNFPVMYARGSNFQYSFFVDNIYRHDWDLTSPQGNYYVNMWGTIRFYVFAGKSLKDLRQKYMKLVGPPKVPAREIFGMQHSLYGFKSFDEIFKNLDATRAAKIPIDGIVIDLYWFGGQKAAWPNGDPALSNFGSLSWDQSKFPNPTANVQKMRSQYGVGVTLIEEPYIAQNRETHALLEKNYALAKDSVFGPPTKISYNPWWGIGGLIDFTAPGSDVWMDCKRCAYLAGCVVDTVKCAGVAATPKIDVVGTWIDLGEPEMYNDNQVYHGYVDDQGNYLVNHGDVHNIYQLLSSKALYDGYARKKMRRRASAIVRTGAPGIQRYGSVLWSGDVSCYLPVQGNHFGSQKHIIMGGIDFYGSDVGGFHREGCVDRKIDMGVSYTRWLMNSVWMDVPFRPHADQHVNGNQDESIQTNPAWIGNVATNKYNIVQRYELLPYYYSLAHHANLFYEPVFQPMFMAFQNDPNTASMGSQFMLGEYLMICTDTEYATSTKNVYLPAGDWFDYHTHEFIKSTGTTIQRNLNMNVNGNNIQTIPVFAKAGSVIPRAKVDDSTLNSHGQRTDGSFYTDFIVRVYPAQVASSFVAIDDDGETSEYLSGARTYTPVEQSLSGNKLTVTIRATTGTYANALKSRQFNVEVVLPNQASTVSSVTIDGADVTKSDLGKSAGWKILASGRIVSAISQEVPVNQDKVFVFNLA